MEGQKESVGVWFYDFILRYFKVNTLESGSKDDFKTQTPNAWIKGKFNDSRLLRNKLFMFSLKMINPREFTIHNE